MVRHSLAVLQEEKSSRLPSACDYFESSTPDAVPTLLPPVGHIHCCYLREGYKLGPCNVAGQVGSQGLSDGRGGAGALKLNVCVLHINTMVVQPCGVGQW